uniref:Uncharacterized protein n=1 Tax=Pyxicephalus adspersus TaxID=30357 RepID=A0AAV3B0A7_PYXAD|nr:TPA: hypothetical protein GDO54_001369 [Pyxicephalus adspersus]
MSPKYYLKLNICRLGHQFPPLCSAEEPGTKTEKRERRWRHLKLSLRRDEDITGWRPEICKSKVYYKTPGLIM